MANQLPLSCTYRDDKQCSLLSKATAAVAMVSRPPPLPDRPLERSLVAAEMGGFIGEEGLQKLLRFPTHSLGIRNAFSTTGNVDDLLLGITALFLHLRGGSIWDFAPTALLVQEAGGVVRDAEGERLVWGHLMGSLQPTGVIFAASPAVMEQALSVLEAPSPDVLAEARKSTVQALFESLQTMQGSAQASFLGEDCVWETMPSSVASASPPRGKAMHLRWMAATMDEFTDFRIEPRDMVCQGDILFCHCRSHATHKLLGPYGQDYTFTFYFEPGSGGKLRRVKEFVDSKYSVEFFTAVHRKRKKAAAAKLAKL